MNLKYDVDEERAITARPIYEEERHRKEMIAAKTLSALRLNRGRNVTLLHITLDDVRNGTIAWCGGGGAGGQLNQS